MCVAAIGQSDRPAAERPSCAALLGRVPWPLPPGAGVGVAGPLLPLLGADGLDDAFYAEVGNLWRHGHPPYLAAYDVKPPGFFALVALSQTLFGPGLAALRAVAVASDAATAVALLFIGSVMGVRRVGWFAFLLYPLMSELVAANDAYCPLAAATTLAVLARLSPLGQKRRAALSGLAIGAAFTIKQTAAFEGVLLFGQPVGPARAQDRRLRTGLAFAVAGAVAPLAFLAYFAAIGGAPAFVGDTVIAALARPGSSQESLTFLGGLARFLPLHKGVVVLFACAGLGAMRWKRLALAAPGVPCGFLFAWLGVAMLTVVVQHAIAFTYLAPELAPLLLLAGVSITAVTPELGWAPPVARLAALAALSLATALWRPGNDLSARLPARAVASAVTAIRASGPAAGDRIFVVNRGFWIEVASGPELQPAPISSRRTRSATSSRTVGVA